MQSIRRAATRASLTSAISSAAISAAPKTQSIAFALRSINAVRCFSAVAPRAFAGSMVMRNEQAKDQVEEDVDKEPHQIPPPSQHCVFVQNYPFDVARDELSEAFSKFGEVVSVEMPNRKTFCFVYFKNAESVKEAVENVDNTFWHGRRMVVRAAEAKPRTIYKPDGRRPTDRSQGRPPKAEVGPTNTIYIGNLSFEATDAELTELFSCMKNVKDIRVAVDRSTGWPRGFAHAEFATVEEAVAAKEVITARELRGRAVRASFAEQRRPRSHDSDRNPDAEQQKKAQTNDWNA